jgi:putative nucleotidyltransferase-like protein
MTEDPLAPIEVRQIAAMGLADSDPLRVDRDRWPLVLRTVTFQRLTGIAVEGWETGRLELEPEQLGELLDRHRSAMVVALAIEQRLLRLSGVFDNAGVRAVVIKGPAVAHTVYLDPSMRPFGDLDLLVSTGDWPRACEVLAASGFRRNLPEPRHGFDQRFGKAATHSDPDGYQVDLHRTLVLGPFGLWLDPEELLASAESFVLTDRRLERLDTTAMLLNAALHAGLGSNPPLLLPLRDVAQIVGNPAVDWVRLAQWAVRWRLTAALDHAFECTARTLGVELPPPALRIRAMGSRRAERRAILAYTERRRAGGVALAATRAIPGIRPKAAYLFGLILPSREFLRARSGGHPDASYASRWRVPFRWIARRNRNVKRLPQPRG